MLYERRTRNAIQIEHQTAMFPDLIIYAAVDLDFYRCIFLTTPGATIKPIHSLLLN